MPKKHIDRPDSFDDYDAEEPGVTLPARSHRPGMPMNEANDVMDGILPNQRWINPKVLLEQEKERTRQLEADLELAKATGQVLAADGTINVYDFQLTPAGLITPDQSTYEAWEQLGHLLFRLEGSIQWLIGDWLLYGEQVQWGETDEIAKVLGREAQTLYHYKSICQKFDFCRRRQKLTFGHHDAVRGLTEDQQEQALDEAEAQGLSVAAFRKLLRGDTSPALPMGEVETADVVARKLTKFFKHNPSSPKQKSEALRYIREMRRHLDVLEKKCR